MKIIMKATKGCGQLSSKILSFLISGSEELKQRRSKM